ncbi:MAG TPA: amidase [Stellaceae bacterium]|nr:amidase [Stellaceae bacterium]
MSPATPNPARVPYHAATAAFASGKDSPRDFLERCLGQVSALEPRVGAFVALNIEGARAAADRATARWRAGRPLSPIDGMPVGIKDIIETEDMPTEQGSPLFTGYRTGRDGASVAALREAGAVVLGKTVTTEFAASEPRGTRNPWDLDRTPGGSSSGSAAAVACGMLPVGLGTQVVGSILRPSSFCGVYGFKPSVGGVNRGGSYDGLSQSCHGALAASLADAWLTVRAITARVGGDPGYPGLSGPRDLPAARKPARLALLQTAGWREAEPAAKAALEGAAAKLKAAGVELLTRHDNAPVAGAEEAIADAMGLTRAINDWEGRWPLNAYRGRPGLSQVMIDRLANAESMSLEDYQRRIAERARIRGVFAGLKAVCDGAIALSATGPAPVGLHSTGNPIFVAPGSLLGVPTLSLPLFAVGELPLGLQVLGFEQADASVVGLARWIDEALAQT